MAQPQFFYMTDVEELLEELASYETQGWDYIPKEDSEKLDGTVVSPLGTTWRLEDCIEALKGKLKPDSPSQREAIKAVIFFNLTYLHLNCPRLPESFAFLA